MLLLQEGAVELLPRNPEAHLHHQYLMHPITAIFVFYYRILFIGNVPEIRWTTKKTVKSSVALIFPNERDFLCVTDRNCHKQNPDPLLAVNL